MSRNDILFALFKHKKKILLGTALGLIVAGGIYFFFPASYESDAKLMVRYLVERSTADGADNPRNPDGYAPTTDSVIGSEIEILNSWDLAVETAQAIGPKRILPHYNGTPSKEAAAAVIAGGLTLTTHKGSNIIFVSYHTQDPSLAVRVLNELVNRYFNKHLEVHRSAGAFDFVSQQTDQVQARLHQTEDTLRDLREKAGIISLGDATKALEDERAKVQDQLHLAEANLAEQQGLVDEVTESQGGVTIVPGEPGARPAESATPASGKGAAVAGAKSKGKTASGTRSSPGAPIEVVQKYQALASGLQKLRQTQVDLFAKYTPQSEMVKANQAEVDDIQRQLHSMVTKYPDLPAKAGPIGSRKGNSDLDPGTAVAKLAGFRAKRDALAARLHDIQKKTLQLSQISPQIADLERQKQLQESNYKYFEASLEKARIDEALDPSKIPNISIVQQPSPPFLVTKTRDKVTLAAAFGGFGLAVVLALLNELILSRKLRRPVEIERFLGLNPLMSIPFSSGSNGTSTFKSNGKVAAIVPISESRTTLAPWDSNHFIRPYSEAIRDRLGLYFELHNLTHKPKLVGVAGFSKGVGTSTLAAGLAAALSETNDGKVLLVDVSLGPDQVHPFFKGKPAYTLNTALTQNGQMNAASENLYLAKVASPNAGPAQLGLKRFFDLMPNMKASDFDYIIFDMPPLEQTSTTWGMAPFMDKMLLVVESEKDSRDAVKRSCKKLVTERDNISLVLNKVRSYAPKRFELES